MIINGRYPYKQGTSLRTTNMIIELSNLSKDSISIRIDDKVNSDFWMEIGLNRKEIEEMLYKMDESGE